MKFVPGPKKDAAEPLYIFQISAREEALLLATLRLFPVLESAHHRISRDSKNASSPEQRLLEESMGQLADSHRRKLEDFFQAPQRFFKNALNERHLVLTAVQFEWLLQVLNNIRVGSWVQLGSPDLEKATLENIPHNNPRALHAMHISGQFQTALLEAVK